jgi:hypothetical protein
MTLTLLGADIRSFYEELGIRLPNTLRTEVAIRCITDPDKHRREDRDPSCSVNTVNGAWHCHGCGASGGAYDIALAKGHSPRSAIDLMIDHGLTERRDRLQTARELSDAPRRPAGAPGTAPAAPRREPPPRATFSVTRRDVTRWQEALSHQPGLVARLGTQRGWRQETMCALGLGVDRGRITIPIRNACGSLRGLLRYQPEPTGRPKMLSVPGSRLGLIPHPAAEPAERILLVEGPPDMIAARSHGLPAIGVPGDQAWQPAWSRLLAGRRVTIIMDCDDPGRAAAQRIAQDIAAMADPEIIDLAASRDDGYDLTDWLIEGQGLGPWGLR